MANTFQFTLDINVEGKKYRAGDTVAESDLPAGSFASLKRQKQLVPYTELPPDVPAVVNEPPPETPKKVHHAHEPHKTHKHSK